MAILEPVTRQKSKLRLALVGPSGAGKTLSALYVAYGITGDWGKIALIDTEHERGRFYAERSDLGTGQFLYASLTPPYSPERYTEYVEDAAKAVGADGVVIVDSFSHAWDNEGGVIEIKNEIAKTKSDKNSFSAWDEAGRIQNNLVNTILSANCHTIVTMRAKMAYAMEVNERGKTVPVKIGLAPVQRENTEYEFDIVLQINREHIACASKDTTFLDTWSGIIAPELGKQLSDWLDNGEEPIRCCECSRTILGNSKRTAKQLAEASIAKLGRVLCASCAKKALERKTAENEAPVPEE